ETELDGEAWFGDVVGSGIDSFGLSHDEFYDVGKTHKPIMEEVRTQEPIVEKVIVKDYVSSKEDAKQGNG
ncbi:hypothetical protein Tco_1461429, partial [Tanacetum coccineum]